jgi:hypothetical protein
MPKFMCTHTLPPGELTREQVNQFAEAAQKDPQVRGYRSFMNLSQGKIVCVMEAPSEQLVTDWFSKMNMPHDSIVTVELEGERGVITEAKA